MSARVGSSVLFGFVLFLHTYCTRAKKQRNKKTNKQATTTFTLQPSLLPTRDSCVDWTKKREEKRSTVVSVVCEFGGVGVCVCVH